MKTENDLCTIHLTPHEVEHLVGELSHTVMLESGSIRRLLDKLIIWQEDHK